MKAKRLLSLLLSLIIIIGSIPMAFAADTTLTDIAQSVRVNLTAQAGDAFILAPQFDISVSSDAAEKYGYTDSVSNGVSVLDALVTLHEIKYGKDFTAETAKDYLIVADSGNTTMIFEKQDSFSGFALNGSYPNDGTESPFGRYNGTVETTQKISNGDTVEFFVYSETWEDELAWLEFKGSPITELTVLPESKVELTLKSATFMSGYLYENAEQLHSAGSTVSGAVLAYVDEESGTLTVIDGAVSDKNGEVKFTAPGKDGDCYITAYMPGTTEGEPLIMSLTKITVDKNYTPDEPYMLHSLSVASFDSNPNALEMTPKFDKSVTEYTLPTVEYPSMDIAVFRSCYVKAAAVSKDAKITAECNGVSVNVTNGSSDWTMLNSALVGGKNNILTVTAAIGEDVKKYTVTIPMKPKANTPPSPSQASDTKSITVGESYKLDLSKVFTDPDEIDTLTYSVSINGEKAEKAEKNYKFTPNAVGAYTLVFTANDGTADGSAYTVTLTVNPNVPAPKSLALSYEADAVIGGTIISQKGGKFKLTANDENGNDTPVLWKNTSNNGGGVTLNESTGEVEITNQVYQGSTSYLYFTATSTVDSSVTNKITVKLTGFRMSDSQKNQSIALSEDGQTVKNAYVNGGSNGHNIWSFDIPDGVGKLSSDPGKSNSVKIILLRPGKITASFKLDINEKLSDSATITVTGIAVEDSNGNQGKTYITASNDTPNPTTALTAFCSDGVTVEKWESQNRDIAIVDENGVVTATGVGNTIITAFGSDGTKGGIKVVVDSDDIPYFETLEFSTTAFSPGVWTKGSTFKPTQLEYDLEIKNYSTSSLMLTSETLFDSEKYNATAEYVNSDGEKQTITVNDGKAATFAKIPFDASTLTITLADKENADKKSVYKFNVTRPRDTSKVIKSNGITIAPTTRELSQVLLNGISEGSMQKCDKDGKLTGGTGVASSCNFYRTFVYDDVSSFRLNISSSTAYAHIRYTTDGESWTELAQGGGATEKITASDNCVIKVQIIDDAFYTSNISAGNGGFENAEPTEYAVFVDKASSDYPTITEATVSNGDFYPEFHPDTYSYYVITENKASAPTLTFTAGENNTVKIGTTEQTPNEDGKYSLTLGTSKTSVTVSSANGEYSSTYTFAYKKKSAYAVPDKVVDYLCIGSQYTNISYGVNPEFTLAGEVKSLGNFGGYITYYYENPITDDSRNKYGIDFYVIGNSSETNIDSMAELGQVYVSEDGETWYALAGSEHYEDNAIWDYTITYTKDDDGKSYWTDNRNGKMDYSARLWPKSSIYYMNNVGNSDEYTFTGIVFECQDGTINGNSTSTASFAAKAKFGYADYYASNISGGKVADVNPYVAKPSKANGFDLAWAVDKDGYPIDVSEKEFHYVKVATASNIYAGMFGEKSTEISYVVRTTAQDDEVGKTTAPTGVTISDGIESVKINFADGQSVYSANLDDMKYVSITVDGTSDGDNVYVNNTRTENGESADGFKVTKGNGTLVRIIVQNGDKEPAIYLLRLTSSANDSDTLINGIKINADGNIRDASTNNGKTYSATVGRKIESIAIGVAVAPNVNVTIDGSEPKESYSLEYGKNTFEITAISGNKTETAVLNVTREKPAATSDKKIVVSFTLYGDEHHSSEETHTYKKNKKTLPVWVEKTQFTTTLGTTVLDVFEAILTENDLTWRNSGGNYIAEINGLSEFDNGALSGWMYLFNGKYSDLGVAEQTLKNGDSIVFHYTDDYTVEEASEKWQTGGGSFSKPATAQTYTVKFDSNGGDAVESIQVEENKTLTAPTAPEKDGFVFSGWFTDEVLNNKYDFSKPVTSSFTLYAKWTAEETDDKSETVLSFADVEKDAWYEEAVKYAVENRLLNGISETEFSPDGYMTRAMVVTVLYRLEKAEKSATDSKFTDVKPDDWYFDAVVWATENGIVNGMGDDLFAPNDNVTREQFAVILYRYAKAVGKADSKTADLSEYTDSDSINTWAYDAFVWANACGIINGTSETALSPSNTATRAESATMLMRFCELIKD